MTVTSHHNSRVAFGDRWDVPLSRRGSHGRGPTPTIACHYIANDHDRATDRF